MSNYAEFLDRKRRAFQGFGLKASQLPAMLFDWQAVIVRWALKKGRAAIFADCGLGKTYMQTSWAREIPGRVLMLAPLCVAEQTIREAAKLGIVITYVKSGAEHREAQLTITNYERLDAFDPKDYAGVVLDESSILKAFDGETRRKLIEMFQCVPYRLCCTATPSPNDISELANHAEFLGLLTRAEFMATWFVHDQDGWRMKGHAVEPFYRWLSTWAVALRKPSDIGYSDEDYELPPLTIHEHVVEGSGDGSTLFPELGLVGIGGRIRARKGSLSERVELAASLMNHNAGSWLAWCGLNTESAGIAELVENAVEVSGSDSYSEKVHAIESFIGKDTRVLVTKPKIAGFGLNLQMCSRMVFVGLSDSYETYYQCIRRCWRFGQTQPVDVHIVVSEAERGIVENVRRKETAARNMQDGLLAHMRDFEREALAS